MKNFGNIPYKKFAEIIENRLAIIANQIQELSDFISDCGGNGEALFEAAHSRDNCMNLIDIVWTLETLDATPFLEEDEDE